MMNSEEFPVELGDDDRIRVDKFVASLGLFSRSQISRRSVRVFDSSGHVLKPSKKLADGERVLIQWDDPPSSEIHPEQLDMAIVYEDEDTVVINKDQGVVVHPAHGHFHGTLVQGLLYRYSGLEVQFGGDRVRPGVVHRLDKDTSGLIIAALSPESLEFLSSQFRDRTVKKTYLAITKGILPEGEGEIHQAIGRDPRDRKKFATGVRNSKPALSRYRVLGVCDGYSLVQVRILTGRTHQIRVHMKSIGCPILGDPIYSRRDDRFPEATLMLHSWKLGIRLPNGEKKRFSTEIPDRFLTVMKELGLGSEGIQASSGPSGRSAGNPDF